jgi:hypothetical protein
MRRIPLFAMVIALVSLGLHAHTVSAQWGASTVVSGYVRTCPGGDPVEGINIFLFRNGQSIGPSPQTNAAGYWQVEVNHSTCIGEDWITAVIGQDEYYGDYHHDHSVEKKGYTCRVQAASAMTCSPVGLADLQFRCGYGALPCPSE